MIVTIYNGSFCGFWQRFSSICHKSKTVHIKMQRCDEIAPPMNKHVSCARIVVTWSLYIDIFPYSTTIPHALYKAVPINSKK